MDYKEKVIAMLNSKELSQEQKEKLENIFPELKNEDEITRKSLIRFLKSPFVHENITDEKVAPWIAWLEKQGKFDNSLYIRFGDIPANEKSKIYRGEQEIGSENGVSVYPAFEDKEGNIILGLNLPITKTSLHTQQHLLEYESRPCYLVTGDYVGKGTDGEPLIKNVRIIKEIKHYRMKQDKENNTYIINNTPNCGISVYNEELKESEDEMTRKEILNVFKQLDEGTTICGRNYDYAKWIAWLEKQSESNSQTVLTLPKFTFNDVLALQCCMETVKKVQEDKELYEKLNDLHSKVYDSCQLEKQDEQSIEPNWCHHKVDLSNCSEEYRKAYYDGWNNCNMQHSQCRAERNDKDERIRKDLINGFKECLEDCQYPKNAVKYWHHVEVDSILAWLEKQGEQKHIDYNEELKKCQENPLYFIDKYVKFEERKPAWSKEDESIRKEIIRILKAEISYTSKEEADKYVAWLEKQGKYLENYDESEKEKKGK